MGSELRSRLRTASALAAGAAMLLATLPIVVPVAQAPSWAAPRAPAALYYLFVPTQFFNAVQPGAGPHGAARLPGPGWWTSVLIHNVGMNTTTITAVAYDAHSPATYSVQAAIPPGVHLGLLPTDFSGMPLGFEGSFVITATQPLRGTVINSNREVGSFGTPGGLAIAAYEAVHGALAAPSVRFPAVQQRRAGEQTTLVAQNAGGVDTAVSAAYACDDGNTYVAPALAVGPGQMAALDPAAAGVPDERQCRATLTASEPLAVVALEHYAVEAEATRMEAARGLTAADAGMVLYAPTFKPRRMINAATGWRASEVILQNVSSTPITITVSYRGIEGQCAQYEAGRHVSPLLAPGATWTLADWSSVPVNCLSAARFAATGPIVGVARETFVEPVPGPGTQSTTLYNLLPERAAGRVIVAQAYKELWAGRSSELQVQNASSITATVYLEFRWDTPWTWRTIDFDLPPGAALSFYHISSQPIWSGTPMPPGTIANVWAFADQPIIAALHDLNEPDCYGPTSGCFDRSDYLAQSVPRVSAPTPVATLTASAYEVSPADQPIVGRLEPCEHYLHDLDFSSPLDGWAVGSFGAILHCDGRVWTLTPRLTPGAFWKVNLGPGNTGWIGGEVTARLMEGAFVRELVYLPAALYR